jgi:hypothetical protein
MTDDATYALAGRLSYEDARRYVESRGWSREKSRRSDVGIFRLGTHEAILPMDTALRDYPSAMLLFARRVAEAEGRAPERVLADLAASTVDRHRPARVAPAEGAGASLDAASGMLDGISRALLAAACSVLQPRQFHPRMTLADAETFIAQARFMNTEPGSFVMVVDTPTEVEGARPGFGREASVLLVRSLAHVAGALRAATPDRIVNPEPDEPQVSANLCEAILRMAPANESADLRFGVTWSPLLAAPTNVPAEVTIDRHMYEAVEKLARQMRPSESNAPKRHLGLVKELKGAPGPTGQAEGEVVFTLIADDGTSSRAKAQLDPERYRTAVLAHAAPNPVIVEGELHRVRRGYELRDVTDIQHWVPPVSD